MEEPQQPMTRSERWATRQTGRSLSAWSLLAAALPTLVLLQQDPSKFLSDLWLWVPFWALIVAVQWERSGFRRLLARRDAELDELRGGAGSV
jgi:peptidoglycan/LPS O-acetylase OafA/YrhL